MEEFIPDEEISLSVEPNLEVLLFDLSITGLSLNTTSGVFVLLSIWETDDPWVLGE